MFLNGTHDITYGPLVHILDANDTESYEECILDPRKKTVDVEVNWKGRKVLRSVPPPHTEKNGFQNFEEQVHKDLRFLPKALWDTMP